MAKPFLLKYDSAKFLNKLKELKIKKFHMKYKDV